VNGGEEMARDKSPTFVLPIKLKHDERLISIIESELEINRIIYNTCLGELLKREHSMKRTKCYKKCIRDTRAVSEKLRLAEKSKKADRIKGYKEKKKRISKRFQSLREAFGLTEYSIHAYVPPIRFHFGNRVNAAIAQKTASRAWNTFDKKLFGKAKRVNFVRNNEMDSFEGKTNGTGWTYHNRKIEYQKKSYELHINPNDIYLGEALHMIESRQSFHYRSTKGEVKIDTYRVKYVQIVRKFIRGKHVYYAHLVCAGYPPSKKNRNGQLRHRMGKGAVGMDIGTSSVAITSKTDAFLRNLGEEIKRIDDAYRQIKRIDRAMDRSKRATNPDNYNKDGTIRKGKKAWAFSNRYKKLKDKRNSLHRRLSVLRKLSHQRMANEFLIMGDVFYVENMSFYGLQKRSKKTEKNVKTGKFKKKKRFGKTIAHRAPALFVSILEEKVTANGGTFRKVNTQTFKASQYDHTTGNCAKKKLNERWHCFADGVKIQRDLYSAFLLMNSNKTGRTTNRMMCTESFEAFKQLHDREIERIEQQDFLVLNSGIRLSKKKKASAV
jgi:hypothetical protein